MGDRGEGHNDELLDLYGRPGIDYAALFESWSCRVLDGWDP